MRFALIFVLGLLFPTAASAQASVLDRTQTSRGLVRDTSVALAAEDAARRAGIACLVGDAVLRDEDRFGGSRHYEIACREGGGFLIVSTPGSDVAHDCLLLAASAEAIRRREPGDDRRPVVCTLPVNADPQRRYADMARDSGLTCTVDAGALVGRSEDGDLVWEIGCRDRIGAWIELKPEGWVVTDCLEVLSLGGRCELTSARELATALSDWTDASLCRPVSARSMGRTAAGTAWFELACRDAPPVVVAREADRTVEVLTCEQAAIRLEPCEGL